MRFGIKLATVKKIFNKMIIYLIWFGLLAIVVLVASRLFTGIFSRPSIRSLDSVSKARVAIVFGAGLERNGSPTPILRDRVETAVLLYKSGKAEKLLMSGDNRFVDYNEPGAMRAYAIELGVPERDIVLDYAGRRTYDTCLRARKIFGLNNAILVTQTFHLPRALFTCNQLGLQAEGVPADRRTYSLISQVSWNAREVPASLKALWDVWVWPPRVVLGDPEPIFTEDN
jgi:SanA protein